MERPADQYIIYYDKESSDSFKNGAVTRRLAPGKGTIIGFTGKKEEFYTEVEKSLIGSTILYKECSYKLRSISSEHIEYLKLLVKTVNTSYLKNGEDFYYIYSVSGWKNFIKVMEESDGVLDDKMVRRIMSECGTKYTLYRGQRASLFIQIAGANISATTTEVVTMTSLEAMERYGIYRLDEIKERGMVLI